MPGRPRSRSKNFDTNDGPKKKRAKIRKKHRSASEGCSLAGLPPPDICINLECLPPPADSFSDGFSTTIRREGRSILECLPSQESCTGGSSTARVFEVHDDAPPTPSPSNNDESSISPSEEWDAEEEIAKEDGDAQEGAAIGEEEDAGAGAGEDSGSAGLNTNQNGVREDVDDHDEDRQGSSLPCPQVLAVDSTIKVAETKEETITAATATEKTEPLTEADSKKGEDELTAASSVVEGKGLKGSDSSAGYNRRTLQGKGKGKGPSSPSPEEEEEETPGQGPSDDIPAKSASVSNSADCSPDEFEFDAPPTEAAEEPAAESETRTTSNVIAANVPAASAAPPAGGFSFGGASPAATATTNPGTSDPKASTTTTGAPVAPPAGGFSFGGASSTAAHPPALPTGSGATGATGAAAWTHALASSSTASATRFPPPDGSLAPTGPTGGSNGFSVVSQARNYLLSSLKSKKRKRSSTTHLVIKKPGPLGIAISTRCFPENAKYGGETEYVVVLELDAGLAGEESGFKEGDFFLDGKTKKLATLDQVQELMNKKERPLDVYVSREEQPPKLRPPPPKFLPQFLPPPPVQNYRHPPMGQLLPPPNHHLHPPPPQNYPHPPMGQLCHPPNHHQCHPQFQQQMEALAAKVSALEHQNKALDHQNKKLKTEVQCHRYRNNVQATPQEISTVMQPNALANPVPPLPPKPTVESSESSGIDPKQSRLEAEAILAMIKEYNSRDKSRSVQDKIREHYEWRTAKFKFLRGCCGVQEKDINLGPTPNSEFICILVPSYDPAVTEEMKSLVWGSKVDPCNPCIILLTRGMVPFAVEDWMLLSAEERDCFARKLLVLDFIESSCVKGEQYNVLDKICAIMGGEKGLEHGRNTHSLMFLEQIKHHASMCQGNYGDLNKPTPVAFFGERPREFMSKFLERPEIETSASSFLSWKVGERLFGFHHMECHAKAFGWGLAAHMNNAAMVEMDEAHHSFAEQLLSLCNEAFLKLAPKEDCRLFSGRLERMAHSERTVWEDFVVGLKRLLRERDAAWKAAWDEMFEQLVDYKAEHGNCLVPANYEDNPALGNWVNTQRHQRKKGQLSDDRIADLDRIDFVWSIHVPWDEMFEQLVDYKAEHGNCLVPANYEDNPALGNWVNTQRQQRKNKKLPDDRITKLDSIGFVWSIRVKVQVPWNTRFEQLKAYKATHGNCLVPQKYEDNPALGEWVLTQRQQRKNKKLPDDRITKLDSIGFVWSIRVKQDLVGLANNSFSKHRQCHS